MKRRSWAGVMLALGCGATVPPERLIEVDAQLSRSEAVELSVTQPGLIGEARVRRDAGWRALRAGEPEQAELNAWIAWQKLRVAENLDAIGQDSARESARDSAVTSVDAPGGPARGRDDTPKAEPKPRSGDSGARRSATSSVQEAEDARLRLVATGGQRDWRWPEAEALLQTAQRALERGSFDRAESLAARALFVFELVRLSSPPAPMAGSYGDPGVPARSSAGPTGPAPRTAAPSRAYVEASLRLTRLRPIGARIGCGADVETASRLLDQAETRRTSGDPGGAEANVTIASDHLKRCDARLARQIATRISPLRDQAMAAAKALKDPEARARAGRLLADADAAVAEADLDGAEAALRAAAGLPALEPVTAAAPVAEAAPPTPAVAKTRPTPESAPAAPASKPTKAAAEPAAPVPAVSVAPTLGFGFGGTAPAPTAPIAKPEPAKPLPSEPPPPDQPRSRIVSERLEPLAPVEPPKQPSDSE